MSPGPLTGIKIIEFTHWLAAPYCGNILSDLGAQVIKIEPLTGDQVRKTGSYYKEGENFLYIAYNHGKKGIALDLKKEEGKKIAMKLLQDTDVLLENFRPGVMNKLGFGYEEVSSFNPKVVYCSISAFGNTPEYVNRPGMDPIIQGMGAAMSMTAMDENSPPLLPGVPIADNSTALMAFGAITTALYEREKSGKGQKIEVNLIDMMVFNLSTRFGQYLATGENPKPTGNQHSQVVPYQAFPTKNGWIMAGAQADHAWEPFCKAIGYEELLDIEEYSTNTERVRHREKLNSLLNEVFRQKTTEEWCEIFKERNILHGPVWGIDELVNSDVIQDHNIIVDTQHSKLGRLPVIAAPIHYSRTKVNVQSAPNLLGEHTTEILQGLGYNTKEIEDLISQRVVYAHEGITV